MVDISKWTDRRKFLSTGAAGIGATLFSGLGSAQPDQAGSEKRRGPRSHDDGHGAGTGGQVEVELVRGEMMANPPEEASSMAQDAVRAESRRSRVDGNTTPPGFQDSLDELQTAVEDGVFDVYEEDGTVMLEPQATEADDLGLPEPASDRARKARKRAAGRGGADGNEGEN